MADLVSFILARIADDERAADVHQRLFQLQPPLPDSLLKMLATPQRLREEAGAKRKIVELEQRLPEKDFRPIKPPVDTPVLRQLAWPHRDHVDYRDEWRP